LAGALLQTPLGAYSAPPDSLAGFKGPTSNGSGGAKGRGEGKGRGGGDKGREEEGLASSLQTNSVQNCNAYAPVTYLRSAHLSFFCINTLSASEVTPFS